MADVTPTSDRKRTAAAWALVAAQFVLIRLNVLSPRDQSFIVTTPLRSLGMTLAFTGGAIGLWSALRLGRGLTASPLPNGGSAVRSGSALVLSELGALVVLFAVKARWEAASRTETFPGYDEYMVKTPRFVPRPARR